MECVILRTSMRAVRWVKMDFQSTINPIVFKTLIYWMTMRLSKNQNSYRKWKTSIFQNVIQNRLRRKTVEIFYENRGVSFFAVKLAEVPPMWFYCWRNISSQRNLTFGIELKSIWSKTFSLDLESRQTNMISTVDFRFWWNFRMRGTTDRGNSSTTMSNGWIFKITSQNFEKFLLFPQLPFFEQQSFWEFWPVSVPKLKKMWQKNVNKRLSPKYNCRNTLKLFVMPNCSKLTVGCV